MQRRRIYMTASYWIDVCALRCACKENPACSFIASIGGMGHFMLRHEGLSLRAFQEKLLSTYACRPYRKPTQVISSSRARRTSECAPRNSAKNRPYLRNKACPLLTQRAAAKVSLATVYQKHSSLRTRKRMYRG